MSIFLKRVYEPYDEADGCRVLIDRLWPRGISKEAAKLSYWLKDVAPSPELRKWFCHKPELFAEFRLRYLQELRTEEQKCILLNQLLDEAAKTSVTLLYGAKDPIYNHAVVLYEELERLQENKKTSFPSN
ncbi:DUF488 domain-containing protein [Neobacillus dielmonensis]|uniref:DUF488 domain-containing protein n=1 Tax=Neobacillus dielmonensis TaxID=1347369 RepID=UPI0005A78BDB|nr:DUF488 domain-containing protein [Neobacillus dielmonensis]